MIKISFTIMLCLLFSKSWCQAEKVMPTKNIPTLEQLVLKNQSNISGFSYTSFYLTNTDLLVIDNKIYNSESYKSLVIDINNLNFIKSIQDSLSKTGIKRIFIYETKGKK